MNNFNHKKIGIWGFGVVGKSALTYFDQHNPACMQILDSKEITLPSTKTPTVSIRQTPESIQTFLENNDIILVSPGIQLHDYQQFAHKFIAELDLYQKYAPWPIIAITGSLGKTSITHLLTTILQKMGGATIAAGNIGYPMLNLIIDEHQHKNYDFIILELSSFQLQQAQSFAPNLAIITNIYENHLDHHKDMDEYVTAKCAIFAHQTDRQIALIPLEIAEKIIQQYGYLKNYAFFSTNKPSQEDVKKYQNNKIYYLDDKKIFHTQFCQTQEIFDLTDLPAITFDANWLIIIAALDLQSIDLRSLVTITKQLDIPEHRLQKIASMHGSDFYNDSKSTVWQATLQAVLAMDNKPIKLFLGGLDKGVDRTPLLQALHNKNIKIYAFGAQAQEIGNLCKKFNITYQTHTTLDASWQACIDELAQPSNILFSPGGSSYDLFDNYIQRGQYFTQLVKNYDNNLAINT